MGADELSGGERDYSPDQRVDLERDGEEKLLPHSRDFVYGVFGVLRSGADACDVGSVSRSAGSGRGRIAAFGAGDPGRRVSGAEARYGDGGLHDGHSVRSSAGADAGWMDHRQLFMALDLLHQHSSGYSVRAVHAHVAARSCASGKEARGTEEEAAAD